MAVFFGLWGWGSFWALTQIHRCHINLRNCKLTTIAWSLKSTRLRGLWSSLVCMPWVCLLCQHVCQHASMSEVCKHARGSSLKWLSFPGCSLRFPEVPGGPRCPEGQDIVPLCQIAQNPQDCTYGVILLEMMIIACFTSHVMAYWVWVLSKKVLQSTKTVSLVLTCTKFSLLTHIHLFIHKSHSTW